MKPVDVKNIVNAHLLLFKPVAEERGLYLEYEFSEEENIAILDERFFRQKINNLVNSAVKFTQQGGVIVKVDTFEEEKNDLLKYNYSGLNI